MKKKIIFSLIIISLILGFVIFKVIENKKYDNKYQYMIITDYKYMTMLDDGGSNYNVYYEINSDSVRKLEDHYIGFKGYEYQNKEIYNKKISNEIKKELINLLDNLMLNDDYNNTNNYIPFVIKKSNEEKIIYNEESINLLKNILNRIDNL